MNGKYNFSIEDNPNPPKPAPKKTKNKSVNKYSSYGYRNHLPGNRIYDEFNNNVYRYYNK